MLYVGRLPSDDSIPDSVVQRLLESVAKPSTVHWKRASDPESGELKRFGHAEVNHPAAASRMLRLLNGFVLPLRAGEHSEAILVKVGSKVEEKLEQWQTFHQNKAEGKPVTTMNPYLGVSWERPSDQEGRDASARASIDEIMRSWRSSAGLRQSSDDDGAAEKGQGDEDQGDGTVENLDDSTRSLISMFRKKTSNIDDYVKERRREVTLKERERARLLAMRRDRAKQKEEERQRWREEQERLREDNETRAHGHEGEEEERRSQPVRGETHPRRVSQGGDNKGDEEDGDAYDAEERAWLERERRMKRRRPEATAKRPRPQEPDETSRPRPQEPDETSRPRPQEPDETSPAAKRPHVEPDSGETAAAASAPAPPAAAQEEVEDPQSVFAKPMPWPTVDAKDLVRASAVPVLEAGLEDLLGVADEELMQFCLTQLKSHCRPQTLVDELEPVLEEEAAPLVRDVWQALLRASAP